MLTSSRNNNRGRDRLDPFRIFCLHPTSPAQILNPKPPKFKPNVFPMASGWRVALLTRFGSDQICESGELVKAFGAAETSSKIFPAVDSRLGTLRADPSKWAACKGSSRGVRMKLVSPFLSPGCLSGYRSGLRKAPSPIQRTARSPPLARHKVKVSSQHFESTCISQRRGPKT